MLNKKLIATVTAASLMFGIFANCNVKVIASGKQSDVQKESVAAEAEDCQLARSNQGYAGEMADLSMAREDKVIEMLKKEGKIPKDATEAKAHDIYGQYIADIAKGNAEEEKNMPKIAKSEAAQKMDKAKEAMGAGEMKTPEKPRTGAKILVVLMQFPDLMHNLMTPDDADFYYKDYSTEHYKELILGDNGIKAPNGEDMLPSMRQYYKEQSGGTFKIDGAVSKWYTSKEGYEYYGKQISATKHDADPKQLVKEALEQLAKDKSVDLKDFDKEDLEGNEKPDGIIDHVMIIHAGPGQEAGGGKYGSSAIWAHSSKVYDVEGGKPVPHKIPGTDMKAFHYTMEPEDAAAGVLSHEFVHDLGYPDEYDTQKKGTGEPVGAWSIMSYGSWGGKIPGTEPTGMSPRTRAFMQANYGGKWINVKEINSDEVTKKGENYKINQADESREFLKVNLPKKNRVFAVPTSGTKVYFGGKHKEGNPETTYMTKKVDLSNAKDPVLTFKTRFDTEDVSDYGYVLVREQGKTEWTALKSVNMTKDSEGKQGYCGTSKGWADQKWLDESMDLKDFAGKKVELRFQYDTDPYVLGSGWFIEDIAIKAADKVIFSDDAEKDGVFELNGFTRDEGKTYYDNYYLVEWRNYHGSDKALQNIMLRGKFISYDPGMVIWYVDDSYTDNWVGTHPGDGFVGVVDAGQKPSYWLMKDDNSVIRPCESHYQVHDAAFGLKKSSGFKNDRKDPKTGKMTVATDDNTAPVPFFDDSRSYSHKDAPDQGRNVPKLGLKIYVTGEGKGRESATIRIKK